MVKIDDYFEYIGIALILINACLYLWSYINSKNVALFFLALYLVTSAFVVVISSYLGNKGEANLHYSHIYFITQFIFLSLFYRTLLNQNQKKGIDIIILLVLLTLAIQYFNKPYLISQFNLLEIFITSVPLIIYSIMHLYNSLSKKGEFMLINAGVLIYLTTSTLIFILGDYLSEFKNNTITKIWMINKILYVIYLVLILVEWKKLNLPRKSKS